MTNSFIYRHHTTGSLIKYLWLILIVIISLFDIQNAYSTTETGKEIYNYYCYQCHGYSGDAKTLASTYLKPSPANFKAIRPETLSRESMLETVRTGRPGTAMVSFASVLNNNETEAVVDYIRTCLMTGDRLQNAYHTAENGWPNHERYSSAFSFITGEISLDTPWENLDKQQRAGKRLYINACISCHDNIIADTSDQIWEIRSVSYPREHYSHRSENPDALSGASIHVLHEQAIPETELSGQEQLGRQLYLDNCAFCHAPDGTAKNWIGSFLDQRPRNFTENNFIDRTNNKYLKQVILNGIENTSMSAWGNVLTENQIDAIIVFLRRAFNNQQSSNKK